MSTLAEKVQAVQNEYGVELEVDGDTVTYPGVAGPDEKGPGTRTFSRADLDEGVFETWFELAHEAAGGKKGKKPSPDDGKVPCPECGTLNQVPAGADVNFTCSNCGTKLATN